MEQADAAPDPAPILTADPAPPMFTAENATSATVGEEPVPIPQQQQSLAPPPPPPSQSPTDEEINQLRMNLVVFADENGLQPLEAALQYRQRLLNTVQEAMFRGEGQPPGPQGRTYVWVDSYVNWLQGQGQ